MAEEAGARGAVRRSAPLLRAGRCRGRPPKPRLPGTVCRAASTPADASATAAAAAAVMAAIDVFGYLFLALGPGAAFFAVFVAPKSFVVLLSIFRCEKRSAQSSLHVNTQAATLIKSAAQLDMRAAASSLPRMQHAALAPFETAATTLQPPLAPSSAFLWLCVLLFTSALLRGAQPGRQEQNACSS